MRRTSPVRSPARRLLSFFKRLVVAAVVAVALTFLASTVFIGLECYSSGGSAQGQTADVQRASAGIARYAREEASTFLTLPEWYIVYNTEEYASYIGARAPSGFPYFRSIGQFFNYYGAVCGATKDVYPFSAGNHLMLAVIGSSFSIEYALKGVYENLVGRLSEWIGGRDTPEDAFAHKTAVEYGRFMHTIPWYEFPFLAKVSALWAEAPLWGPHPARKWERKLALTVEYGIKGVYGWLIRLGSKAAYGDEDLTIHAWVENVPIDAFADRQLVSVKNLAPRSFIVRMPRYEAFTARALDLIKRGGRFVDIAGNDDILLTALAPPTWKPGGSGSVMILDEPFLTDQTRRRVALKTSVRSLHTVVADLQRSGATVEHIYDY